MYALLGPLQIIGNFIFNLFSVHNPAKFQQYSVIFAKSAANAKVRLFFRYSALFLRTLYYIKLSLALLTLFTIIHTYTAPPFIIYPPLTL